MCVIRRHFRWLRADSRGNVFFREIWWPVGWVPTVRGKRFFREILWPVRWVTAVRGETFFREILVARPVGPYCQAEE